MGYVHKPVYDYIVSTLSQNLEYRLVLLGQLSEGVFLSQITLFQYKWDLQRCLFDKPNDWLCNCVAVVILVSSLLYIQSDWNHVKVFKAYILGCVLYSINKHEREF